LEETLAKAVSKLSSVSPPPARSLPVEPKTVYPLDSIKAAASMEKFDARPYIFSEGDYDIAIMTPVLKYHLMARSEVAAAKEKLPFMMAPRSGATRSTMVRVNLGRETHRRSTNQNSYYWGVVIQLVADYTGAEPEEIHAALKFQFAPKRFVGNLVAPATTRRLGDPRRARKRNKPPT
jgi:hypothetical protein